MITSIIILTVFFSFSSSKIILNEGVNAEINGSKEKIHLSESIVLENNYPLVEPQNDATKAVNSVNPLSTLTYLKAVPHHLKAWHELSRKSLRSDEEEKIYKEMSMELILLEQSLDFIAKIDVSSFSNDFVAQRLYAIDHINSGLKLADKKFRIELIDKIDEVVNQLVNYSDKINSDSQKMIAGDIIELIQSVSEIDLHASIKISKSLEGSQFEPVLKRIATK